MKRLIFFVCALTMCFSLCACGKAAEPAAPVEVELTPENIEEYLAMNFDYSKVERKTQIGISFGYTDITFNTYAVKNGSFNNVELTVEIPLSNGWSVSSSDGAYDEANDELLKCTFRLPANGTYSETHDLIAALVYSDPDNQNIKYNITSVSGTFVEG